jgi:hypothetical protein
MKNINIVVKNTNIIIDLRTRTSDLVHSGTIKYTKITGPSAQRNHKLHKIYRTRYTKIHEQRRSVTTKYTKNTGQVTQRYHTEFAITKYMPQFVTTKYTQITHKLRKVKRGNHPGVEGMVP